MDEKQVTSNFRVENYKVPVLRLDDFIRERALWRRGQMEAYLGVTSTDRDLLETARATHWAQSQRILNVPPHESVSSERRRAFIEAVIAAGNISKEQGDALLDSTSWAPNTKADEQGWSKTRKDIEGRIGNLMKEI